MISLKLTGAIVDQGQSLFVLKEKDSSEIFVLLWVSC